MRRTHPDLSSNDIIHAFFLKIIDRFNQTSETEFSEGLKCRVLFARNMRKPVGLGAEVVGDYVRLQCFGVDIVDV